MPISLPEEAKREIISSIKQYFLAERGEELGDLQAAFLLDFVLEEIAPSIFNLGVRAAQARMHEVVADLDVSLQEPEFGRSAGKRTK